MNRWGCWGRNASSQLQMQPAAGPMLRRDVFLYGIVPFGHGAMAWIGNPGRSHIPGFSRTYTHQPCVSSLHLGTSHPLPMYAYPKISWWFGASGSPKGLIQGLATFFSKGTDSKYFRFWGYTVSVTTSQLCCIRTEAAIINMQKNEWLSMVVRDRICSSISKSCQPLF